MNESACSSSHFCPEHTSHILVHTCITTRGVRSYRADLFTPATSPPRLHQAPAPAIPTSTPRHLDITTHLNPSIPQHSPTPGSLTAPVSRLASLHRLDLTRSRCCPLSHSPPTAPPLPPLATPPRATMSLNVTFDDFDPPIVYSNPSDWVTPDPSVNPTWYNASEEVTGVPWHEGESSGGVRVRGARDKGRAATGNGRSAKWQGEMSGRGAKAVLPAFAMEQLAMGIGTAGTDGPVVVVLWRSGYDWSANGKCEMRDPDEVGCDETRHAGWRCWKESRWDGTSKGED